MTMRYEVHRYEIVTADDGELLIRAVPVTQADWNEASRKAAALDRIRAELQRRADADLLGHGLAWRHALALIEHETNR